MTYTLRPYQQEATNALHEHICTKETNPCVVLPTGSGKSIVMAAMIQQWKTKAPWIRGSILAHRKELVQQNYEKLKSVYPAGEIGIFSAGLGQRDYTSPILFASIDSVFKKSGEFQAFDFLFVDEAQWIPPSGDGKYRTFINGCRRINPNLRVIGWTATAYRMNCGPICHKNHILQEVCYEAGVADLIAQGFLSNLRSKEGESQPNLSEVRRNSGGDYIIDSLADATNRVEIVKSAITEAVRIMKAEGRRSAVFFTVSVDHCKMVSAELRKHGINAPYITGKTKRGDRDRLISDFKGRRIHAICCVNVLTEGFDAPHIDCIVLLRPTLSAGLYVQMIGRGLRTFPGKDFCLVLDFAGCIDEHGPIDLVGTGEVTVMATCKECRESFSRMVRVCPECGWEIPKQEVETLEAMEEKRRRWHSDKASKKSILSGEPEVRKVDDVYVARHVKPGSRDSLRVQYRCGMAMLREWICLDHGGYAGTVAQQWWDKRFGRQKQATTVSAALSDMFLRESLLDWTKTITTRKKGKHVKIIGYNE